MYKIYADDIRGKTLHMVQRVLHVYAYFFLLNKIEKIGNIELIGRASKRKARAHCSSYCSILI